MPILLPSQQVAALPSHIKSALATAMQRYEAYIAAFGPGEEWLQRKVKEEVGSQLITLKQRCAGLDPEWNKVSAVTSKAYVVPYPSY